MTAATRDRRLPQASGPDAYGKRHVLPRLTGAGVRVPAGTCPGCGADSHPGTTCSGYTTAQVSRALYRMGAVYVPLRDKDDVR